MIAFFAELERELRHRGLPSRERERIRAELADHLACDPAADLGAPADLARGFAAGRAAAGARRGAWAAFAALALTAVALLAGQLAQGAAGGTPGFDRGHSTPVAVLALLAIVLGSQTALVAGVLAVLRAVRRRGAPELPDAEVALVHRRAVVALGAGLATAGGLLLYVADFTARLAPWWLWLQAGLAALAAAALTAALVFVRREARIRGSVPGAAGDLRADLPVPALALARPWALCAAVVTVVAGLAVAGTGHAEHSLLEGLERGVAEGLAIVAGFAVLGRAVGARQPRA